MLLLPKTVGPFTLLRKLGADSLCESYLGQLDAQGGTPVVVRRILPTILRDAPRISSIEARVRDLLGMRHPFLVQVLDWVVDGDERFIVEAWVDGVDLDRVLDACRQEGRSIPHNVFLNLATQVCNGLEALHGRSGKGSGATNVLHLGLRPGAIFIARDGKVMLGGYGLSRSEATLSQGGAAPVTQDRLEYLAPEQTQAAQQLSPASDIFSLGAVLYELLTLEPLFRAEGNLQTLHRIRKAEVGDQLKAVKDLMPGLDKVLYRALSLNPRHRYQRAFVLREDLRGLMAGYSFNTIVEDTRAFLAPLFSTVAAPSVEAPVAGPAEAEAADLEESAELSLDEPVTGAWLDFSPEGEPPPVEAGPPPDAFEDDVDTRVGPSPLAPSPTVEPELPTRHTTLVPMPDGEDEATQPETSLSLPEALPPEVPPPPTLPDLDLDAIIEPPSAPPPAPRPDLHLDDDDDEQPPVDTGVFLSRAPASTRRLEPALIPVAAGAAAGAAALSSSWGQLPPEDEDNTTAGLFPPDEVAPPAELAPPPPAQEAAEHDTVEHEAVEEALAQAGLPPDPVPPGEIAPPAEEAEPPSLEIPPSPATGAAEVTGIPDHEPPDDPLADAAVDPNSTRGFLLGHAPRPAVPPSIEPAPVDPGFDLDGPPRQAAQVRLTPGLSPIPPVVAPPPPMVPEAEAPPEAPPIAEAVPGTPPKAAPPEAAPPVATEWTRVPAMPPTPPPPTRSNTAPAQTPAAEREGGGRLVVLAAAAIALLVVGGIGVVAFRDRGISPSPEVTAAITPEVRPAVEDKPAAPAPVHSAPQAIAEAPPAPEPTPVAEPPVANPVEARPQAVAASRPDRSRSSRPSIARSARPRPVIADPTPPRQALATLAPARPTAPAEPEAEPPVDIDRYAEIAAQGALGRSDMLALELVEPADPTYSRARALLLMDAQRKGDRKAEGRYISQLMEVPENRYNPVYLADLARWEVNEGSYRSGLETARTAERHWARIPSDLIFAKKAEIYEIQAAAAQGLFYQSEDDMQLLHEAIRGWERYREHAAARSRTEMVKKADETLATLKDIQDRLQ